MKAFSVYLLRCSDGTYYVGHTDDLENRLAEHQNGSFGGHTFARRPVTLLWSCELQSRGQAFAAEMQIKGWTRRKKEALIRSDWKAVRELSGPRTGPDLRRARRGR